MNISIEKLREITHLYTHSNCPDGIASALIIKDALPDIQVTFLKHGTKEHREIEAHRGMLWCDFTPFEPRMHWIDLGVLVLDHHPTQKNLTMAFVEAGLGAYGENDKNECGAWLAYEHVWKPLQLGHGPFNPPDDGESVKRFAELAGVRDTWKKDDPRWQAACEQAEALMFWGFDELKRNGLEGSGALNGLGRHLFAKKIETANNALKEAYSFVTTKGTLVHMFQGVFPTSDAAEILEKAQKEKFGKAMTNIVAGFHYRVDADRLQLTFSTRSHTGYDVGAFCKAHGGGGHSAAAGFTVEQSAEVGANPYTVFRLLLGEWEQGR